MALPDRRTKGLVIALLATLVAMLATPARADFNGDEADFEFFTTAAGSFPQTAVIGDGVEYTQVSNPVFDVDPVLEADIDGRNLVLRYTNDGTELPNGDPCPTAACQFNWGFAAFEITNLNSIANPGAEISNVVLTESTWPEGTIADVTWGPDSVRIEFACPDTGVCTIIDGFGTVWEAEFSIETGVNIPRGSLLGAETETTNLLAVDPGDGTGEVIGATGIDPFTAIAKSPTTGVVYGAGVQRELPILYTYQTIVDLIPHGMQPQPDNIDTLVIDWITPVASGPVSINDLTYLSVAFLAGGDNLYFDISIIDGVVQPIAGVARDIDELVWDFNLNTNLLNQLRNATDDVMGNETASGLAYQVEDGVDIMTDSELRIERFVNGDSGAFGIGLVDDQSTRLLRVENAPTLYEIDAPSGHATAIGILGADVIDIHAADFDANGTLWATLTVDDPGECEGECNVDVLATIDLDTGAASVVGDLGAPCLDGISFDAFGTLWGVSSCLDALYTIDLMDGDTSFETNLVTVQGNPIPGDGFHSLQFACGPAGAQTLYAGTGEDDGDGGDLFEIFAGNGQAAMVGDFSATDGSSLGGLALYTTCGTTVVAPTPPGNNVPVVSMPAIEEFAQEVVVAGDSTFNVCVGRDARWTMDEYEGESEWEFNARTLMVSELAGTGSCTGPLAPGSMETWETDIFPFIDLTVAPRFRSYPGEFLVPGDQSPTLDYWMVLAVVRTEAEFNGVVVVETVPEDLIDYSGNPSDERPSCDVPLNWRNIDLGGVVEDFESFPNFEGDEMIVDTGQCNRSRSTTRRTTHLFPVRLQNYGESNAEFQNITAQFAGILGTINEAASCADPAVITALTAAHGSALAAFNQGQYAQAQMLAEQISRIAKQEVDAFAACPIAANYRGNLLARGVTLAFTVHDRHEHPQEYELYLVPADLEIPILASTSAQAPATPTNLVGRAKSNRVNLAWDAVPGATSYKVFRRLNSEISFEQEGDVVVTAFVDNLPAGTTAAEYYVIAVNGFGLSAPTDVVEVAPTVRRRR